MAEDIANKDNQEDEAVEFETANPDTEVVDIDDDKPKDSSGASTDNKKKLLIIGGVVGVVLIIIIIVLVIMLTKKPHKEEDKTNETPIIEKLVEMKDNIQEEAPKTKIEEMIKKANMLYEKGYKKEALELFESISSYSESLSYYNIGVAHMKEENYQNALDAFKLAIQDADNMCVSAINAAVCALMLNDKDLFQYYIDLAYSNLPQSTTDPLYKYYYALVKYYKGEYLESLSALKTDVTQAYESEQNHIKANLAFIFNDNITAIEALEKTATKADYATLGLLFAREGQYDMALNYLTKANAEYPENSKIRVALGLIHTKVGNMNNAASEFKDLYKKVNTNNPIKEYPVRVYIKDSIFDKNIAQDEFAKRMDFTNKRSYDILFYFAPYKIFNSDKTIGYIRKGNKSIYIDAINDAKTDYQKSTVSAKVNSITSKAIKLAINYHVRDANKLLGSIIDEFPNDSILHYNLALTYAQMQIYNKAYEHFSKSFHLDNKNAISGIFAIMCGELSHDETKQLSGDVKAYLSNKKILTPEDEFNLVLVNYIDGNYQSAVRWLDKNEIDNVLANVFKIIVASKLDKGGLELAKAEEFKKLLNDDIIANILYVYAQNRHLSHKEFAKKANYFLKEHEMFLDSLYYGPVVVKEMYVSLANIAGMAYSIRDILKERVMTETVDSRGVTQSLALTDIYLNFFEEAYTLYNNLIDKQKEDDTHTLFLSAVAAIGAGHHSEAIALLELANLADKKNDEARYALGLLYLEANNMEAAGIQFGRMSGKKFQSEFFDFDIRKKNND